MAKSFKSSMTTNRSKGTTRRFGGSFNSLTEDSGERQFIKESFSDIKVLKKYLLSLTLLASLYPRSSSGQA